MGKKSRASSEISIASDFHFQDEAMEIRNVLSSYGKQGHICCYCCCDTRRATIMMNSISVVFCCLGIAGVYLASADMVPVDEWLDMAQGAVYYDLDDDNLPSDVHYLVDELAWVLYTFLGICILFAIFGIVGAVSFRPILVFYCAMWYLIQGIATLVLFGWGGLGILVAGIWVYPNIMLYQEQVEGIMTKDNYENEIHSCCCVTKPYRTSVTEVMEKRLGVYA